MNWHNLLKNRCPKCKKELWFDKDEEMICCTISCGFMIAQEKMSIICSGIVTKRIDSESLELILKDVEK